MSEQSLKENVVLLWFMLHWADKIIAFRYRGNILLLEASKMHI